MPVSQESGCCMGTPVLRTLLPFSLMQFWDAVLCPALSRPCTLVLLSLFFKDDIFQGFPFVAALSPLEDLPHSSVGCECSLHKASTILLSRVAFGKAVCERHAGNWYCTSWVEGDCHHTCTISGKVLQGLQASRVL